MSSRNRSSRNSVASDSDKSSIFSVNDDFNISASDLSFSESVQSDFDLRRVIADLSSPEDVEEAFPLKKGNVNDTAYTEKGKRARKYVSKEERDRLKAEKEREKILKKEARDILKRIQPATCMEYVQVKIDSKLCGSVFGSEIIQSILQYGSNLEVCDQDISHTITWTTKTLEAGIEVDKEAEPVLIILDKEQFKDFMLEQSIVDRVKSMQKKKQNKKFSLVIFGIESWLKELDKAEEAKFRSKVLGTENKRKRKSSKTCDNFNFLSRSDVEEIFVDLQLLHECCIRIADTAKDVGNIVHQFTKAIAETPYKLEKQKQVGGLGWLATCDTKDCVRVNKSGNGLAQLWLQQLMQFNNSALDVAQAIVQQYPTPLALYKAYCLCDTSKKGEELLKDIVVRRGFGESAAKRRVGPELSKKIYYFFTSLDPDLPLSQE